MLQKALQNLTVLHMEINTQLNGSGASVTFIHFSTCLLSKLGQKVKAHCRMEIIKHFDSEILS